MHILITGGTGFIGSNLCSTLIAKGHHLTVYSRRPSQVEKIIGHPCRAIDKLSPELFKEPIDAIVNLAGEPIADARWTAARKESIRASRMDTTAQLVALCSKLDSRPKVLVSASAVGYYGSQEDQKVTENTPPKDEFTHQICAEWEQKATEAENFGVRVAIARIGLVVGKGGFLKKMLTPFRLGVGGKIGNGKQWMPWIHIQDMVQVLLYLLENENCHGAYNAVSPQPVTNAEFTRALGKVLGKPTVFTVPKIVLEPTLGELSRLLLTGQQAFPERLLKEEFFQFRYDKVEAALRDVV